MKLTVVLFHMHILKSQSSPTFINRILPNSAQDPINVSCIFFGKSKYDKCEESLWCWGRLDGRCMYLNKHSAHQCYCYRKQQSINTTINYLLVVTPQKPKIEFSLQLTWLWVYFGSNPDSIKMLAYCDYNEINLRQIKTWNPFLGNLQIISINHKLYLVPTFRSQPVLIVVKDSLLPVPVR